MAPALGVAAAISSSSPKSANATMETLTIVPVDKGAVVGDSVAATNRVQKSKRRLPDDQQEIAKSFNLRRVVRSE